jgi:hypothetical protein
MELSRNANYNHLNRHYDLFGERTRIMSRARFLLAHAAILFILGSSLYCIAVDREYWPFSQYPMFSWVFDLDHLREMRLYGVPSDRTLPEFPLQPRRHLGPLSPSRVRASLMRMGKHPDGEERRRKALRYFRGQYDESREAGLHGDPPLGAVRLYLLEWFSVDPRTFDSGKPESRTLIMELEGAGR